MATHKIIQSGQDAAPFPQGEIYRSDTLCVRASPGSDTSRWFVTFDHVRHDPSLDRAGFGEDHFRAYGISVVAVVGCGNDWYQYRDMPLALAAIRRALAPAERRITYGSSMGAYAAIRFADAVGADACIALSPQYSVDPRKVPFEDRWRDRGRAIQWLEALDGPIRSRIEPILIYDDRDHDALHARLVATDTRLSPIAIPFGAHPVATYLGAAGLLGPLLDGVHQDTLDVASFAVEARQRRKSTPLWIGELARRQPPHRLRLAERLARDALSRQPECDLLAHILAQILTRKRSFGEALQLHARAFDLSGRLIEYGLPYGQALLQAGFAGRALDIAQELHRRFPHSAMVSDWTGELHLQIGDLDRAIAEAADRLASLTGSERHDAALAHYRCLLRKRTRARKRGVGRLILWLWRRWGGLRGSSRPIRSAPARTAGPAIDRASATATTGGHARIARSGVR